VILQLQDRIIKLDREMDQLLRDKELYLRVIAELSEEEYRPSSSDEEMSMEMIPSFTSRPKDDNKILRRKKKEKKISARQEAFERAKAWALDRKRAKNNK